jgi:shikimate dehydrogenase
MPDAAVAPLEFRLLGHGIAYSASPPMMAAAFTALGMPHRYVLANVAPDKLPAAVDALRDAGAGGANVTTPHKVAVAALVDVCSDDARELGAVNTVVRDGDRLVGHNTDLPALIDAIGRVSDASVGRAVILGAGGAARAVELALARCGADSVTTLRRSDGSWAQLAERLAEADLVVNSTPVGTGEDASPVPAVLLRPDLAVLDLVYRPSPTRLVREARAAGARAEAGAGVLLGQGWRSLELWLGRPAPIAEMAAGLRSELGGDGDV